MYYLQDLIYFLFLLPFTSNGKSNSGTHSKFWSLQDSTESVISNI